MAEFSLQELHDEIEADPAGLGYKTNGDWIGDQAIADLINAKSYTVDNGSVQMESVRAACTYEAYNTLAIDEQEWLRWMTPNSGEFRVTTDMKTQLTGRSLASNGTGGTGDDTDSMWATAHRTAMCAAMLALVEVAGSRAEVLWGVGRSITARDVGFAELL